MAAAGVSSVAATKGVSLLAKWIIGSAAVATTAVVTTITVLNSNEEPKQKAPEQQQISTPAVTDQSVAESTTPIASVESNVTTNSVVKPDGNQISPMGGQVVLDSFTPFIPVERTITPNELPIVPPTILPKNTSPTEIEVIGIPEESTNDEYFIKCKNIASIHVIIQNTENRLVYETTDLNFRWNGRINGTEDFVEKGTYACIAVYQDLNGKTHKKIILIDVR